MDIGSLGTRQTASPKTVRLRVIVMAIALVGWSLPTVADESSLCAGKRDGKAGDAASICRRAHTFP